MKNSSSKNQSFSRRSFCIVVVISILFLTAGCDKSESLITPANPAHSSEKLLSEASVPQQFLEIDHHSIGLGGHDYKVVLFDNGTVLFEGRANVAFIGEHASSIDMNTVAYIKNIFLAANFYNIPSSNPLWRMPFVETTFSDGLNVATVSDVNDGVPQILLQIRSKAEELMQVDELIERGPATKIEVDID